MTFARPRGQATGCYRDWLRPSTAMPPGGYGPAFARAAPFEPPGVITARESAISPWQRSVLSARRRYQAREFTGIRCGDTPSSVPEMPHEEAGRRTLWGHSRISGLQAPIPRARDRLLGIAVSGPGGREAPHRNRGPTDPLARSYREGSVPEAMPVEDAALRPYMPA